MPSFTIGERAYRVTRVSRGMPRADNEQLVRRNNPAAKIKCSLRNAGWNCGKPHCAELICARKSSETVVACRDGCSEEVHMSYYGVDTGLSMLLNGIERQPEDRQALLLRLQKKLGELRDSGVAVPEEITSLEDDPLEDGDMKVSAV